MMKTNCPVCPYFIDDPARDACPKCKTVYDRSEVLAKLSASVKKIEICRGEIVQCDKFIADPSVAKRKLYVFRVRAIMHITADPLADYGIERAVFDKLFVPYMKSCGLKLHAMIDPARVMILRCTHRDDIGCINGIACASTNGHDYLACPVTQFDAVFMSVYQNRMLAAHMPCIAASVGADAGADANADALTDPYPELTTLLRDVGVSFECESYHEWTSLEFTNFDIPNKYKHVKLYVVPRVYECDGDINYMLATMEYLHSVYPELQQHDHESEFVEYHNNIHVGVCEHKNNNWIPCGTWCDRPCPARLYHFIFGGIVASRVRHEK